MAAKWKRALPCGVATSVRALSSFFASPVLPKHSNTRDFSSVTVLDRQTISSFSGFMSDGRGGRNGGCGNAFHPKPMPSREVRFMSAIAGLGGKSADGSSDGNGLPSDIAGPGGNSADGNSEEKGLPSFITADHLEGVELDVSGPYWASLEELLRNHKELCFENHDSSNGFVSFAPFMTRISEKMLYIAMKKCEEDSFFRLDASEVFVKYEGQLVLEVAISESILEHDVKNCFYKDQVVGPFAAMLYSSLDSIVTRKDGIFKEICCLIDMSSSKWWNSLADIMVHSIFWTIEERFASIQCARMFLSDGISGRPLLSGAPARPKFLFTRSMGKGLF